MDSFLAFLSEMSPERMLLCIALAGYFTGLGVMLNNNDVTVAGTALLAASGKFSIVTGYLVAFLAVALGESTTFLVGSYFRERALSKPWVRKRISLENQLVIADALNRQPLSFLIAVRLSPALRAWMMFAVGALGMKRREFFSRHIPIFFVYSLALSQAFYHLGGTIREKMDGNSGYIFLGVLVAWIALVTFLSRGIMKRIRGDFPQSSA